MGINMDIKKKEPVDPIPFVSNEHVCNEVAETDKAGRLEARESIERFSGLLTELAGGGSGDKDQINADGLREHLFQGVYVRELLIPKETAIVSKIWSRERMWIIATGEVTFTTEMGVQRVKAPFTKLVPPGSKVALFTHEETLWFAITSSEAKDLAGVERDVTVDSYDEFNYPWDTESEVKQCLGQR